MNWSISLLFLSALFAKSCCGEEVYVTAFPNGVPCPLYAEICHDISFYSAQVNNIGNNTEIIFLEGTHQLPSEGIVIQHVVNVTLRGVGNGSASVLQCSESGGIVLVFTEYISIAQLTFRNCGTAYENYSLAINVPFSNCETTCNDNVSSLLIYYSVFMTIMSVNIYNSTCNGLIFKSVVNINISNSEFINYNPPDTCVVACGISGIFNDSTYAKVTGNSFVNIENTNVNLSMNGLCLTFLQQSYLVNCTVKSSHFMHSKRTSVYISAYGSCQYNLNFDQIVSSYSMGTGIAFNAYDCGIHKSIPLIVVSNSTISYNFVIGFSVYWRGNDSGKLSISSSIFTENSGSGISALGIYQNNHVLDGGNYLQVTLIDLQFRQNKQNYFLIKAIEASKQTQFTVSLSNLKQISFTHCTFTDNIGSAIFVYDSVVTFSGTNTFMNNTGVNGGGLYITNGFIVLSSQAHLHFINNHAENNGGAIYVEQRLLQLYDNEGGVLSYCFYQLQERITGTIFVFQNNTAGTAGSAVYAGLVDNCISIATQMSDQGLFSSISSFIFNQTGNTVISSNPHQVCFCSNESSNCYEINRHFTAFPGEIINVSIVLVGEQNGYTSGIVQIASNSSVQPLINMKLDQSCTQLSYTVLVDNSSVTEIIVNLTVAEIEYDLFQRPLTLNVTVVPCSEGFELSNETKICECFENISKYQSDVHCFSSSQTIQRSSGSSVWIGKAEQTCTVVVLNCSFDYCNSDEKNLKNLKSLTESDKLCNNSRTGRLCGKCKDNYSLILGSNKCWDCSNKSGHAAIIIVISIMGILLICLIFLINLTVSVGTINGLIFFANIVKLYEPFFPIESIPFLSQFISWINLDMGIETCFYNGMNAHEKVGLQFLFPFYLWLIVVVVIIASKRSSRIARFTGNNTIPVLATVILLSYTKLLRTVIIIFLVNPYMNCSDKMYWSIDPTQEYLHGRHILLFVIGIVVMVFLIVPFTLFLLLFPLLELSSGKCRQRLSWFIITLKPFFDAYRGFHTDIFCFWPGALVVVRIGLSLTVAFPKAEPLVVLFVTMVLLISIYGVANIYKPGQYVYFLDIGLLVNLAFLANLLKIKTRDDFANKHEYPYIGITLILTFAFIVFVGVLLYHIFRYTYLRNICSRILKKRTTPIKQVPIVMTAINNVNIKKHDFSQLREALLDEPY